MIKAVVFDWGGVLIDNPSEDLIKFCSDFLNVKKEDLKKSFLNYSSKFEEGKIREEELWSNINKELNLNKKMPSSLWKNAVENIFKDKKEMYDIIKIIQKQGYKTAILSNTEIPTIEYFYEKKYDKYFDLQVFSCIEKISKPKEKIYQIALERLNAKPQEVIFIDDKKLNIDSAKNLGINTILFESVEKLIEQLKKFSIHI